jgi:exodeoxyribonuclease VII small subunit
MLERGDAPVSFSEDMNRLKGIVAEFETGQLGMEESLTRFEEGVSLIKNCREFLENAKRKVELLTKPDA